MGVLQFLYDGKITTKFYRLFLYKLTREILRKFNTNSQTCDMRLLRDNTLPIIEKYGSGCTSTQTGFT